jgi:hypothetical protein
MEVKLKHSTLAVALKCNLECRLCLAASPYYDNAPIYSYRLLSGTVDEYFKAVNYVEKFTLTGGEPLLNKALPDLIKYLEKHRPKIGFLEIITNGTIVPSENLVSACKDYGNMFFLIDDYGAKLSRNAGKAMAALAENGIDAKRRVYYGERAHLGGWVDFGDLTLKHEFAEGAEKLYAECAYSRPDNLCFGIYGGKVSICSVSRRCAEKGIIPADSDEILDLLGDSIPAGVKKDWFLKAQRRKSLNACRYCNGMTKNSTRHPAGEQLKGQKT